MDLESELDVAVDEAVEFTLTVENGDTEPAELEFRSGLISDFAVYAGDSEVWRWSDGRMFAQAIQTVSLSPGESLVRTARWENPSPGEYTAVASLEAVGPEIEVRRELSV